MPKIVNSINDPKIEDQSVTGFLGGLNSFQDETVLKDSELTEAKNILLSVDGIEPRPGTSTYGTTSGSRVLGLFGYYKSDGTRQFLRYSYGANNKLQYYSSTTPTDIGSNTFDASARMNFVQARDLVFGFNGVDSLWKYDGTTITTYTALTTPTTPKLYAFGTTGATTYSYRVSAFNAVGETLASTSVQIANGNSTLNATNYIGVTWTQVTNATGYNVWGREATGLTETYLGTVQTTNYYTEDIVDADINTGTDVITVVRDCVSGEEVKFTGGGTMPTGITAGTSYYVIRVSATTIKLATSYANAIAGTPVVDITAVGSGVRTMQFQAVYQYLDQGQDDPSLSLLPPEANTTTGVKGTMCEFAISRLFVAGNTTYPSRLYFGGTGENIGNFSGSDVGGGAVDVFRNDGAIIRAIKPFQGGVIIWKDNAIYKFSFTDTGLQKLEEITRSFGGISYRGVKHVENDIIFPARKDGRLAIYSLGNQENYASTVLRTNELSIKIASRLTDVNTEYLPYSAAFYFNNIYGCAIPTDGSTVNDRIWCLDTRFGAWVYWEGITPNCFSTFVSSIGTEYLYYGDEGSGLVKKMFEDTRGDSGTAIDVEWATKAFNQKMFKTEKIFYNPTFQFKSVTVSGALEGDIIVDGVIVNATFSVNQQNTGGAGVGVTLFGFHLPGDAPAGTDPTDTSADIIQEVFTQQTARSIKYRFRSSSATARYKFLSLSHGYQVLDTKRIDSAYRTYATV